MKRAAGNLREGARPLPSLELELARDVGAPGIARAALTSMCADLGVEDSQRQSLVLLVSEVVSNAVLHSGAPDGSTIGLLATRAGGAGIRVTVTDGGAGFTPRERDSARVDGGYGLFLVERASDRWGVEAGPPASVWFEVGPPS